MATFNGIGISAYASDGSKILYSVWGDTDRGSAGYWQSFNIVDTSTGRIVKTIGVLPKRQTGIAAIVSSQAIGLDVRWKWGEYAELAPKSAVLKWVISERCPVCNGVVNIENDYRNQRVILSHLLISDKTCILQTNKTPDAIQPEPTPVHCERCGHENIYHRSNGAFCSRCASGNCEQNQIAPDPDPEPTNEPVNPVSNDKLDIIWNQALPMLNKNVQTIASNVIDLTARVTTLESTSDSHSERIESHTRILETQADINETLLADIETLKKAQPTITTINVVTPDGRTVHCTTTDKKLHPKFHEILTYVSRQPLTKRAVYLYGPAGSGKTTLPLQIAEVLNLTPYLKAMSLDDSATTLVGDINRLPVPGSPEWIEGLLYKPYKYGGLAIIDEIAAADASANIALNALLANDTYTFANGETVTKNENFRVVACDNTSGTGATIKFVARNPLDRATLDRFWRIEVGYDEDGEFVWAGADTERKIKLVKFVQSVRHALSEKKIEDVVVSPRASIALCALADLDDGALCEAVKASLRVDINVNDWKDIVYRNQTEWQSLNIPECWYS